MYKSHGGFCWILNAEWRTKYYSSLLFYYVCSKLASYTAPAEIMEDVPVEDDGNVHGSFGTNRRIVDRESDYSKRRLNRTLSPTRHDAFSMEGQAPDEHARSYADVMKETQLAQERENTLRNIELKKKREAEEKGEIDGEYSEVVAPIGRKSRWDSGGVQQPSDWDGAEETPRQASRWDATPVAHHRAEETPSRWDSKEAQPSGTKKSRWDATPAHEAGAAVGTKRSRWDATPAGPSIGTMATPVYGAGVTPAHLGATPVGGLGMETPAYGAGQPGKAVPMTPDVYQAMKVERELEYRNRALSDEDLDSMLPGPSEGYKILEPPPGYQPIRTPARKLTSTPAPIDGTPMYAIPEEDRGQAFDVPIAVEGLPDMKAEDQQYFGKLLSDVDESSLSLEEAKERRIMKLLLKVKNGTPPQRKTALKHLTEKAREFGAGPLFNQILPLLMSPTLEDQERHLLVKVIDRILFRLDELVRPYVHKILVVIEPLLIDEDYYARVEGREIIANLAKAAGLATMIAAMRPDIDNVDEYVRNTTARAFSVVASALGIQTLLPFLKAVCMSKKSWQARHTGIKIVQQIAILMGCAILPHLTSLVGIIKNGASDMFSFIVGFLKK